MIRRTYDQTNNEQVDKGSDKLVIKQRSDQANRWWTDQEHKDPPPNFIVLASSVKTMEVEVIEFHRICSLVCLISWLVGHLLTFLLFISIQSLCHVYVNKTWHAMTLTLPLYDFICTFMAYLGYSQKVRRKCFFFLRHTLYFSMQTLKYFNTFQF